LAILVTHGHIYITNNEPFAFEQFPIYRVTLMPKWSHAHNYDNFWLFTVLHNL